VKRTSFFIAFALTAAVAAAQQTTPPPSTQGTPTAPTVPAPVGPPPPPQLPQPAAQQPPVTPPPTQMSTGPTTPMQAPTVGASPNFGGSVPQGVVPQTVPATPTPTSAMQVTNENRTMMLALLERIEKVTNDQMKEDSKSGKLSVDRSELDEILANVSQIKTMLQK
jgi:hypothetical protein